jgi:hypothetical protein
MIKTEIYSENRIIKILDVDDKDGEIYGCIILNREKALSLLLYLAACFGSLGVSSIGTQVKRNDRLEKDLADSLRTNNNLEIELGNLNKKYQERMDIKQKDNKIIEGLKEEIKDLRQNSTYQESIIHCLVNPKEYGDIERRIGKMEFDNLTLLSESHELIQKNIELNKKLDLQTTQINDIQYLKRENKRILQEYDIIDAIDDELSKAFYGKTEYDTLEKAENVVERLLKYRNNLKKSGMKNNNLIDEINLQLERDIEALKCEKRMEDSEIIKILKKYGINGIIRTIIEDNEILRGMIIIVEND